MVQHYGPNAVVNVRLSIGNTVPCRQVPSDNLLFNNDDGVCSYPQTINLRVHVNNQPWVARFEVNDRGRVVSHPCNHC